MQIINSNRKNTFEITGVKFYGEIYNKAVQFPDYKRFYNGRFLFKNSFSNIEYLIETFPEAKWTGETAIRKLEYLEFKESEKKLKESKTIEVYETDFKFKTDPFKHQTKAFCVSKDLPEYGYLFEQGCGKTKVVLDNSAYLFDKKLIDCLIIIAPNGVHRNWISDEIPKHLPCECDFAFWKSGMKTKDKENWDNIKYSEKLKVYTFNVECFVSDKAKEELEFLLKSFKCLLCVDESQKIKNPSAKRTKFIVKVSGHAKYRRICTGTPITQGVHDIYTQLKFLNPDIIGISSFYAFRARYCVMGGFEMKQIVGYRNIKDLQEKIKNYTMRVLKKDCLDLPEKIYQRVPFDITKKQRDLYNSIKKEGIGLIQRENFEDKEILLEHAVTRYIKMQQISSGFMINTEDKSIFEIVPFKKNPKLLKLKELLAKIKGKVIIWSRFTQDINLILKLVGEKGVRYDGQVSDDQREINKNKFQNNQGVEYFIGNPQVGSNGLTLVEAETVIYYSNSYDLELRLQSEDRCHRIGTVNNVNYIDLEANKTIDKKIIRCLRNKKKVSDMILNDPVSAFLED